MSSDESDAEQRTRSRDRATLLPSVEMGTANSASSVAAAAGTSSLSSDMQRQSSRDARRQAALERRKTGAEVKLRLNEDGEVDWRGSWRDTWHQRFLLIINFCFLLFGFALLLLAVYAMRTNMIDVLSDTPLFQAIAALGLFVVVLSLIGCCGAYYEIRWLLIVYAIVLWALLVAQLSCGVFVFSRRDQAPTYITEAWATTPNTLRVQVQNFYSCCGLFAFNDSAAGQPCPQAGVAVAATTLAPVPTTTAPISGGGYPTAAPTAAAAASAPTVVLACLDVLAQKAQSVSTQIGTAVITLAACQLGATILVVWMLCRMRSLRRKMEEAAALPTEPASI